MVTIGVVGDFGIKSVNSMKVADLIKSWNPDIILTAGDNLYSQNQSAENYKKIINPMYKDYILTHESTNLNSKPHVIIRDKQKKSRGSRTKFLPCVGNHDFPYHGYTSYFGVSTYYTAYLNRRPNLIKFISLNNYRDSDGNFERKNSIQRTWLENELSSGCHIKWIIVYFHYPQLCSNGDDEENNLTTKFPFHNYRNVCLIISGHHHIYERLVVNGITNVVVGTGGHSIRKMSSEVLPQTKILDDSGYGALKIVVENNQIKCSYILVKNPYNPKDEFVIV